MSMSRVWRSSPAVTGSLFRPRVNNLDDGSGLTRILILWIAFRLNNFRGNEHNDWKTSVAPTGLLSHSSTPLACARGYYLSPLAGLRRSGVLKLRRWQK